MEEKYVIKYTYINVTLIYTYYYIYFIDRYLITYTLVYIRKRVMILYEGFTMIAMRFEYEFFNLQLI